MILFPAIDLKDGRCVRLKLGDMAQATVYNEDPAAQARDFERQGFRWLHVVDLNGAFAGESVNGAAVEAILKATKNPVQLGGGIRSLNHIEHWLSKGLARVILGTIAVRDPALVKEACKRFPGKIAVGIDAKGGKVAVKYRHPKDASLQWTGRGRQPKWVEAWLKDGGTIEALAI